MYVSDIYISAEGSSPLGWDGIRNLSLFFLLDLRRPYRLVSLYYYYYDAYVGCM